MIVTHGNGLIISLIFWGAIVAIVFVGNFFSYRERTSRHRMIEKLADKGQPIPPELLAGNGRRDYYDGYRGWRRHSLSGGIYLMCVGVAISVFLWAMTGGFNWFGDNNNFGFHGGPNWLPFVGIFPFMVGLARVIAYAFDRPPTK
jgi:hypothetical protein